MQILSNPGEEIFVGVRGLQTGIICQAAQPVILCGKVFASTTFCMRVDWYPLTRFDAPRTIKNSISIMGAVTAPTIPADVSLIEARSAASVLPSVYTSPTAMISCVPVRNSGA